MDPPPHPARSRMGKSANPKPREPPLDMFYPVTDRIAIRLIRRALSMKSAEG